MVRFSAVIVLSEPGTTVVAWVVTSVYPSRIFRLESSGKCELLSIRNGREAENCQDGRASNRGEVMRAALDVEKAEKPKAKGQKWKVETRTP